MKILGFLAIILIFSNCLTRQKEIYVCYGESELQAELFKFFNNINDGLYVDIGGYDPIMFSTTIGLYGKGWKGLNFQANPTRAGRIPYVKIKDINLNIAVGDSNKFVTLYEWMNDPSQSTVSAQVVKFKKETNPRNAGAKVTQILIPSMSLKQICERLYTKTPNFMNIDVEGYGYQVLTSNDWKNIKCRPQIILLQSNHLNNASKLGSQREILEQNNYKLFKTFRSNQFYIDASKFEYYSQKSKKNDQIWQSKELREFRSIYDTIKQSLGLRLNPNEIWVQNKEGPLYFYFPGSQTVVDLVNINKESNKVSINHKNRPIIMLQFDSPINKVYIDQLNYELDVMRYEKFNMTRIKVVKANGESFITYILNLKNSEQPAVEVITRAKNAGQIKQKIEQQVDKQRYLSPPIPSPVEGKINLQAPSKARSGQTKSQPHASEKLSPAFAKSLPANIKNNALERVDMMERRKQDIYKILLVLELLVIVLLAIVIVAIKMQATKNFSQISKVEELQANNEIQNNASN